MERSYYSNTVQDFLIEDKESILGKLVANHSNRTLEDLQRNSWITQIEILKEQLQGVTGKIYFEFIIPRMGKRVDNIVIIDDVAFIIEFKINSNKYEFSAISQVIDYTIDLKNFHEGSHSIKLIPVVVATQADAAIVDSEKTDVMLHKTAAKANQYNLKNLFNMYIDKNNPTINVESWENSIYKPTPTIIEAAQALYKGHNVKEITRSDAGAINLSNTTNCINRIIEASKLENKKAICFVTGVPGAGKTLAGLNIAIERMKIDEEENAVFLSGNGPLVEVLREALIRDSIRNAGDFAKKLSKKEASIKAHSFIQNIHHFRDDNLLSSYAPIEKVVIFDEAQRAWNREKLTSFMKKKKGIEDLNMSEPQFLIDVMNRHSGWSVIICLIGGGQEINTGESGLEEWINSLKNNFTDWNIYYSNFVLKDSENYLKVKDSKVWLENNAQKESTLHLAVSLRSFRAESLSDFVYHLLNINQNEAKKLYSKIKEDYPIVLTRNFEVAKKWLQDHKKGSERIGLISSSGAKRLKPLGIDVKNEIKASEWFLNDENDIRSSYFLECVATEFDIQGLEIDWVCVGWGANFYIENEQWKYRSFKGTKWQNIKKEEDKEYLKNAYRVLLTRARQGMVIFIPEGSTAEVFYDKTRSPQFYNGTYEYLKSIGILEIS
ncbi:DUF2075 domain-containing protein [Pasteurella skyensis]|uniref:DUF2075 domain-containing protein n=1 Tax=Phocoenobacter skyensis TaxID=97481 RepID=A0AAJ6N940_9PAST|nr:DUF2075 domain-containing protein [Pasteurella skyensis]MDP8162528.1 DUF2075 domain-containing protein [Pasteurella skyensis]MDP8172493.1 DUF2075 domain-containing protein [Pasteurella skyensis]MDP8177518.1 DUF2075 domain-containing protein [Pasteurella skyensis]MDP8178748.1 DUF2075 domain-containing protein [Pasteurella skyensis]MDP8182962.1 DUF2075 domain-containing protein [Pasteurella skyensis]